MVRAAPDVARAAADKVVVARVAALLAIRAIPAAVVVRKAQKQRTMAINAQNVRVAMNNVRAMVVDSVRSSVVADQTAGPERHLAGTASVRTRNRGLKT